MLDYVLLSAAAALGAFGAYADGRRFRRPWSFLALLAGFALGYVLIAKLPASWVYGALFTVSIYLVAMAAVGVAGYLVVGAVFVVAGAAARLRRQRKPRSS